MMINMTRYTAAIILCVISVLAFSGCGSDKIKYKDNPFAEAAAKDPIASYKPASGTGEAEQILEHKDDAPDTENAIESGSQAATLGHNWEVPDNKAAGEIADVQAAFIKHGWELDTKESAPIDNTVPVTAHLVAHKVLASGDRARLDVDYWAGAGLSIYISEDTPVSSSRTRN